MTRSTGTAQISMIRVNDGLIIHCRMDRGDRATFDIKGGIQDTDHWYHAISGTRGTRNISFITG